MSKHRTALLLSMLFAFANAVNSARAYFGASGGISLIPPLEPEIGAVAAFGCIVCTLWLILGAGAAKASIYAKSGLALVFASAVAWHTFLWPAFWASLGGCEIDWYDWIATDLAQRLHGDVIQAALAIFLTNLAAAICIVAAGIHMPRPQRA